MTEAEWLAGTDPVELLGGLGRKVKPRKRRLFACACCYRIWSLIPDESCRAAVVAAEKHADGLIDDAELKEVWRGAHAFRWKLQRTPPGGDSATGACCEAASEHPRNVACVADYAKAAKRMAAINKNDPAPESTEQRVIGDAAEAEETAHLTALLRDVFGNPFQKLVFKPAWRTADVKALATGMYEEKAFDRMPILADALQDAGCDSADLLNHCRGAGPHVRGCWVVDSVLEKG